jgi:CRISPR-associated endonuclease/helicase Cas3
VKKLYSYKLNSHENILLINHLKNVGDRCSEIITEKDIKFSYEKEKLMYVSKVMGYTHDLGKGTKYFQRYLDQMINYGKSDVDKNLRCHGYLSALYTYHLLKDYDEELALMAFTIVKRHHGNLENSDVEYTIDAIQVKSAKKLVKNQLNSLEKEEIKHILEELGLKYVDENLLLNSIEDIAYEAFEQLTQIQKNEDLEKYIVYKFLFSCLIFGDKEDAIFHKFNNIKYDIPYNIVDEYKKIKFKSKNSKLGNIRNQISEDVEKGIKESNNRIMSITAPTGTGKTLMSMSAALKLKKKLNKNMKIIYCLPFTSVIDQNYEVYSEIIEKVMGEEKVTNDRILKHHHLSEVHYISEWENYNDNKAKFLIENWNSQIIVTTFMQFFNTVFSSRNSELVKYNSIANSIVLLDEVQSLPFKYWLIINKLFKVMAEKLNIYFIFITATQPLIFEQDEIKELIDQPKKYFDKFKRTKLHVNLDSIDYNSFLVEMENMILENEEKNILIILNTVKLAQSTYEFIKSLDLENTRIYFLSTGIIPKERRKRIREIKTGNIQLDKFIYNKIKGLINDVSFKKINNTIIKLNKIKKRKIVISTQLIEAGVDIDMDIVVRDLATLDSINQSAGRCNRENRGEYLGDVHLYNINNENGKEYNSFIYDNYLISKTKEVLSEKNIIYEEEYLDMNKEYFEKVRKDMSEKESKDLIEAILKLNFKDVANNFKLIDSKDKVSVFIEVDEQAKNIWNEYKKIMKQDNPLIRREMFNNIKKDFYDNVINIFKNKVKESEEMGIAYVPYEGLCASYNKDTGYKVEENDVIL